MDIEPEPKADGQHNTTAPFHRRFRINVPFELAQRQFINRVLNDLDAQFPQLEDWGEDTYDYSSWTEVNPYVARKLGKRYFRYSFADYVDTDDFYEFLKALEALYEAFKERYNDMRPRMLEKIIAPAIESSDIDLGIEWRYGVFWPSGAESLDDVLVDDNLRWLSDLDYTSVLEPFRKGLRHLLEARSKPEHLKDTVTEMYEALEALAKLSIGNNKDLSGNREALISMLKLSDYYKRMLKDYIDYANDYRHPPELGKKRVPLSPIEVEAFVYTTGLFIRLVIQQLRQAT